MLLLLRHLQAEVHSLPGGSAGESGGGGPDSCLCSAVIPGHLKTPAFQMDTVTSALISGVIILGVVSVCFFVFSLSLLKGKSAPLRGLSGVHNPAFS